MESFSVFARGYKVCKHLVFCENIGMAYIKCSLTQIRIFHKNTLGFLFANYQSLLQSIMMANNLKYMHSWQSFIYWSFVLFSRIIPFWNLKIIYITVWYLKSICCCILATYLITVSNISWKVWAFPFRLSFDNFHDGDDS